MIRFFRNKNEMTQLKNEIEQRNIQTSEAANFIKEIEKGNLQSSVSEALTQNSLGQSLISIRNHLSKIAGEEQDRNWLNEGLAKFSDILRNKKSLDVKLLADDILSSLVKYVGCNQGALFVVEEKAHGSYLQMLACYAYDRKKFIDKEIQPGEGIVGQCMLEKQPVYLKEIPSGYVRITSGLGEATPRTLLVSPLLINDQLFGVIELASFNEFSSTRIDFISRLSENIAATIKNVKENERVLTLLNSSQQQSEELRAQEEEMRQSMEELQTTQEEMKRKSDEVNQAAAEMSSVLNGINATMATVEFTPDGTILNANDNFLRSMKYRLDEIKGKHHRLFVPPDITSSKEYTTFWSQLASGRANSGIFRRMSAAGDSVWLNAIYNPIVNAHGQVIKVVKFANDITAQQELLAESKGIMKGIDATMALIEFTPDGKVLQANENFLRVMNYRLEAIQGKAHAIFVPDKILDSEDYKSFWTRLRNGDAITGVFERKSSDNKTVYLNAIYNPILNANGKVVKVIKFATDVTAQHAMNAN